MPFKLSLVLPTSQTLAFDAVSLKKKILRKRCHSEMEMVKISICYLNLT